MLYKGDDVQSPHTLSNAFSDSTIVIVSASLCKDYPGL